MLNRNLRTGDYGRIGTLDLEWTDTGSAPITTADLKAFMRVDTSADDDLIDDTQVEVIDVVEREYNFTIIDKTVTATWDSFAMEMPLPMGPVDSINSVKTIDQEGDKTTLTVNEDYRVIGDTLYIEEIYAYEYPYQRYGLEVIYTTGWDTLPKGIERGIKQAVLSWYEDRQDIVGGMAVDLLPDNSRTKFERYRNY